MVGGIGGEGLLEAGQNYTYHGSARHLYAQQYIHGK